VAITAQLIQASTDRHLWAKSYQREMSDVLALEREVAQNVAEEVGVKLGASQQAYVAAARTVVPESHEDYLLGLHFLRSGTREGTQKAVDYFQAAVVQDPNDALSPNHLGGTLYRCRLVACLSSGRRHCGRSGR